MEGGGKRAGEERNGKLLEVGTEKLEATREGKVFKIKQETRK